MKRSISLCFLTAICLYGCAPTTEITGSWTNPDIPQQDYDKIFVAAMTSNLQAKRQVEEDLAATLREKGVTVETSSRLFPPNFTEDHMQDKRAILDKVREEAYGAILTVSLIDKESERRYVPGNYGYAPITRYGWYGNFWGYYSYMYPMMYEPGYYTEEKIYFIETNLYDTETEKLIWSAQSESYDPRDLESFSDTFAEVMIEELNQDNLI